MKIAFIVSDFPALSETFILNQIVGLIKSGYEVDIYASINRNDSKVHPDVDKYHLSSRTYYAASMPNSRSARILKAIRLFLSNFPKAPLIMLRILVSIFKHKQQLSLLTLLYEVIPWLNQGITYDILHCHFGWNGLKGVALKEIGALQGKLITTFHGVDVNAIPQQSAKDYYLRLFQKGDLYTVNTDFTKKQAVGLGCPQNKIVKLPVGLEISQYAFCERKLIVGEAVKIITVGRLVEKKGIEYGIKAIAKVVEKNPKVIYTIVGDGILRKSLENLILELDISENIKLVGWMTQEQVRQLYAASHIFMLPSVTAANGDREGQALVLQEAQAMGLPVVSTLHNGIPEGLLDGKSGFLVPEKDVEALAEKLNHLVEHPEEWLQMGKAGRKYVENRYNIPNLNNQLVEMYKQLLS